MFIERFGKKAEPRDVIREATDALLNEGELATSVDRLDAMYMQAGFNNEAKFGFFRVAVTKIPNLASFAMYRGANSYAELKRAVKAFGAGKRAFQSPRLQAHLPECIPTQQPVEHNRKNLVRPDARVRQVESKVDQISE